MFDRCRVLAVAAVVTGFVGCDSKSKPEPSHAIPPLNAPAEVPAVRQQEHAVHDPIDPMGGAMNAQTNPHAGMDPHAGAEPHAQMAEVDPHADQQGMTPGDIPFDKSTVIQGKLSLVAKTKDKVATGDTIFVVVRGMGAAGVQGPVLAVKRLDATTFPMPFQIDSRDAMVAGTTMKAPVTLQVRVDKDGDAITKNPGDVVGTATLKTLPAELTLPLDQVL